MTWSSDYSVNCAGNPVCLSIRAGLNFFHQPNIHQDPGQQCLDMILGLEYIHKSFNVSALEDWSWSSVISGRQDAVRFELSFELIARA